MTDESGIKEAMAAEAVRIVTGARRRSYGAPEDNFQRIAERWNLRLKQQGREMYAAPDVPSYFTPVDVADFMRDVKEARLIETRDHYDSMVDHIGYTLCRAELLQMEPPRNGVIVEGAPPAKKEAA